MTTTTAREKEVLNGIIEVISSRVKPDSIYLFGSRAKETGNFYSDFDIWIEAEEPDFKVKIDIMEDIEKFSGLYTVDLIFSGGADEAFKDIVMKTGVKVYG